jgi:hypothetical protein
MEIRGNESPFPKIFFSESLHVAFFCFDRKVGPRTTPYETHCLSTHLTRFTSGIMFMPESIQWNPTFDFPGFLAGPINYLTVIVIFSLYILLITYARLHDRTDLEKVNRCS